MAKRDKRRKKAAPPPPKEKIFTKAYVIAGIIIVSVIVFMMTGITQGWFLEDRGIKDIPQLKTLKQHVLNASIQDRIKTEGYIVFISLCDKETRARVVKGKGKTLEEAWSKAEEKAGKEKIDTMWAKADIVLETEAISQQDLNDLMLDEAGGYSYFLRRGVALDKNFDIAFLESEMNGNRLYRYHTNEERENGIDYTADRLNLININTYLGSYTGKQNTVKELPEEIVIFTTIGFFCDEKGKVYDLYDGTGTDSGRRITEEVDADHAYEVMVSASESLYSMIKPDGEYIYGFYAATGEEIDSYNILRHAGSIWSLINLYRVTEDDSLIEKIDAAIDYLLYGYIVDKGPDTAFVVERKTDEIKLGGNGLTIIMLTEYMDVFKTDRFKEVVTHLANGILELQKDNGEYYHVLNYPDFSLKEEFRTIYYDGEATFALTRAYTLIKDEKYLQAAVKAVEMFIEKDYTVYRDHWVAYSMNEITKYIPDQRYFDFALRNASENFDRIASAKRTHPTYLELLMAVWETNERMKKSGIEAKNFDEQKLAETIYTRAFHMLNAYFYPEYAMYMKYPSTITGSVFIRDDRFRVRIDDIQHFIGGYYFYHMYYDDIRKLLTDDFIKNINSQTGFTEEDMDHEE